MLPDWSPLLVCSLKVTLADIEPPIWRRVEVPADLWLPDLHLVIQAVMGWTNSHLHSFRVGPKRYLVPDPDWPTKGALDERKFQLGHLLGAARFVYEYDFGDSWDHVVEIEVGREVEDTSRFPLCIGGARACPPEDSGGISGYDHLLTALSDPEHPEHAEMVEWTGGDFDPQAFDLKAVNATLAGLRLALA